MLSGLLDVLSQPYLTKTVLLLGAPSRGSQPHPHPLTQVYRTGSAYNPFYPPYQEYVSVGAIGGGVKLLNDG